MHTARAAASRSAPGDGASHGARERRRRAFARGDDLRQPRLRVVGGSQTRHRVERTAGALVNGPYALITTAVSADLGTHESLKGNARALATVTAIIDGTGSIGAAIGPMLTGFISAHTDDWNNVFFMLYAADLVAGLLLMKLVMKEIRAM